MTLTEVQRSELERLRKKYPIQFEQSDPQLRLRGEQQRIFDKIRALGKINYDEFASDADTRQPEKPWRLEAKNLAFRVSEAAGRCCRRTESTWRYTCEPLIFARVNADVACSRCRKRLWRSEVEASADGDSVLAARLQRRQGKRQSCRCERSFRIIDVHEANGLSKIFGHREDEEICHSDALQRELPKHERPDRVYGLRETRNFENILHSQARLDTAGNKPGENNTLVIDSLDVSLHSMDGDRLLFPFLVLEAKSGKANDDWHSIKLQSCFPIRSALELQQNLRLADKTGSRDGNMPLVWFFMSRGEDWRVCFAFIEEDGAHMSDGVTATCRIIDLWNGNILTQDGALQLILIVDYIFDWARDIYRPTILTNLQALLGDTCDSTNVSLDRDSDIFSTKETASTGNEGERSIAPPRFIHFKSGQDSLKIFQYKLCIQNADPKSSTHDPFLKQIKELVLHQRPRQLLGRTAETLREITDGFLDRVKTSSTTQDFTDDFETFQYHLDLWKLAHNLPTVSDQEFKLDRRDALQANEAILQRTIVISIIDRFRLNKMFTYDCEGHWLLSQQDLLPAKANTKMNAVSPDLVIFYDLESFLGRPLDSDTMIPVPLKACAFPDGNSSRCFPFLFIEAKKAKDSLEYAFACNMHNASQALWNMYKWMVAGDRVDAFFDLVRVFTISLNAEKVVIRLHRAVPSGSIECVLKYLYDDLYISYDYSGADVSLIIRNLLLEYGVARLRGHLIAAYEKIIGHPLPRLRQIPKVWELPEVRDAVERMEAIQAQSGLDTDMEVEHVEESLCDNTSMTG